MGRVPGGLTTPLQMAGLECSSIMSGIIENTVVHSVLDGCSVICDFNLYND